MLVHVIFQGHLDSDTQNLDYMVLQGEKCAETLIWHVLTKLHQVHGAEPLVVEVRAASHAHSFKSPFLDSEKIGRALPTYKVEVDTSLVQC